MYKELTIKNLKIFKEEQKLKIAPITLLYGENSSGKTSLLKTFDIFHNIFFEKYVKRGKNVSQKDNPFYRNENIQNISAKRIHYFTNQLNKKPIKIEAKVEIPFDFNNEKLASIFQKVKIKKLFRQYQSIPIATPEDNYWLRNKEEPMMDLKRATEEREMLSVPINIELEIKYYSKEKISRVKSIIIKREDGKEVIKLTREDKKYKKLEDYWDKDKVGWISPYLNNSITRPNRYLGTYHRNRPIVEKDYFVDDALHADYKIHLKNDFIWTENYNDYKKIFLNEDSIKKRLDNYKLFISSIIKFKELELKQFPLIFSKAISDKKGKKVNQKLNKEKTIEILLKYFSYSLSKYIFFEKEEDQSKNQKKIDLYFKNIYDKKWCSKIMNEFHADHENHQKLSFVKIPKKKTLFEVDKEIKSRDKDSYNKMAIFQFCNAVSNNLNVYIIQKFLSKKKPVTFTEFRKFAKLNTEGLNYYRFYKDQKINIQHRIVDYAGRICFPTFDHLQFISKYIYGGLNEAFYESPSFAKNFKVPVAKETLFSPGLLSNILDQIELNVDNYVICHPSKTSMPWGVPNKNDFPDDFDKRLNEIIEKESKKTKNFVTSENKVRSSELESFLDPKMISADGINFHRALISSRSNKHSINDKLLKKLNKILKETLELEIVIVTPDFLQKIWKDPEKFAAFKLAQRYGYSYPVGSGKSSRTKYIMLRDRKFKKNFHIHGEEVGKGPTNILPFLGQIMSDEPDLTYIIQELENNWHPKYQAKIMELIAQNMLKSKNKKFILETHSELFVLQLKKLVQKRILKSNDVSINFISRSKDGNSKITNIPLNDIGGFEKEWPGGFFTERMDVLTS